MLTPARVRAPGGGAGRPLRGPNAAGSCLTGSWPRRSRRHGLGAPNTGLWGKRGLLFTPQTPGPQPTKPPCTTYTLSNSPDSHNCLYIPAPSCIPQSPQHTRMYQHTRTDTRTPTHPPRHMRTDTRTHTGTSTHTDKPPPMCTHQHTHALAHAHTPAHAHTETHPDTHTLTHVYTCAHTSIHAHTLTCTRTLTHPHIHTQSQ